MHPFSVLTLGIFVAGYITARWDLVTRLYELAIFAWDHGVVVCLRPSVLGRPSACDFQLAGIARWKTTSLIMFGVDTNCERLLISLRLLFPPRPAD
jgi:phosphatidylinositol glycan class Q protein